MNRATALVQLIDRAESASRTGSCRLRVISANEQTGEPAEVGEVLAERGELLWARSAATGSDLSRALISVGGLAPTELRRLTEQSRLQGVGISQLLLDQGGLSEERLRRSMLVHLSNSLGSLAGSLAALPGARIEATNFSNPSFRPRFSFNACELIGIYRAANPEFALELPRLPRLYRELSATATDAICYLEPAGGSEQPLPVDCRVSRPVRLETLRSLYASARQLVELGGERDSTGSAATMVRIGGRGWFTALEPPYFCLLRLSTAGDYGTAVSHLRISRRDRAPESDADPLDSSSHPAEI